MHLQRGMSGSLYTSDTFGFLNEVKSFYSALHTGYLYTTNSLVFITEIQSFYSAVRTGSLNKAYLLRDAPPTV
jgi:hypothetical protein